jgi:hypothetical protein
MQSKKHPSHPESRAAGSLLLPTLPHAPSMWQRALTVAAVVIAAWLLDRATVVMMTYWLLESEGLASVFWTNFRASGPLFVFGFAAAFLAVWLGGTGKRLARDTRPLFLRSALIAGMLGGYFMAGQYLDLLQLVGGLPVGEVDPVFGHDVGFYMFSLPAYWGGWTAAVLVLCASFIAQLVGLALAEPGRAHEPQPSRATRWIDVLSTRIIMAHIAIAGVIAAFGLWLARFGLLYKDNRSSAVYAGAEHLDVDGLFSNLNHYWLRIVLVLALAAVVVVLLRRHRTEPNVAGGPLRLTFAVGAVVAADLAFAGLVATRDSTFVKPNEPLVQLPYIQRHVDATRRAYGLDKVETVELFPAGLMDPLPSAEKLLENAALRNAPLWPGWVSYLERVVDPQHADRILKTKGDPLVYGPMLDVLRAQHKLRSYYDFLDVDSVRYVVDGEKRMFVSSVREVPFIDPKPWITWWGQRMLLFTHSHGMVIAPASAMRAEGEPDFAAHGIPMQSNVPSLRLDNPAVYYGEGFGGVMAFTNARNIMELDYPTNEGRAENVYPASVDSGVRMDSILKRIVVGWRSGVPFNVWFSSQIVADTRLHYGRPPLDRLDQIAPFLYYDSNPFAVIQGGRIQWMVNAMTTSDRYPYSHFQPLGDKSNEQALLPRPHKRVNYVKDSVKATVDAYTGKVVLYKIADEPIVNTWARIYPALFREGKEMPDGIRAQLQYPRHLMHIQFDNIYYMYHMTDPMTLYNLEDMWDDADEVKGPILSNGKAITFSIEPRQWMVETGGILPAAQERTQFVVSMVYTNEQALNLRAIPIVYQDGPDYGRMVVLQVPKGHFYPGPEQADAAIDQEPEISEQISWWNRTGSSVIRGHTSTLVVDNEIIYVEPLFTRSEQNPVSQLKRVLVVVRGIAAAGDSLETALKSALKKVGEAQEKARLLTAQK